jgi:hypothetical protein
MSIGICKSILNFLDQPHQVFCCEDKSKEWKMFANGRAFVEFTGLETQVLRVTVFPNQNPVLHFDFVPLGYGTENHESSLFWIACRYPGDPIDVDTTVAFDKLLQNTHP